LRHTVVCLAQLEHHFSYRFLSHWRQIEESFIKDFDIKKKLTLRKYSNFGREVGKLSVGDPSIIRARHWETSKQNLIGLNCAFAHDEFFLSRDSDLFAHEKEQLQAIMLTCGLKVFLRRRKGLLS
jgi:hypothetical protein